MVAKKAEYDISEPNNMITFVLLIIFTILMGMTIFLSVVYFRSTVSTELSSKETQIVYPELEKLRAEENEMLNNYRWKDKSKGIVQLPTDKAIEKVVQKYR